jgi:nitrogen fixation protein NifB
MVSSKRDNWKTNERANMIRTHPCFSEEAHHRFGRIHLPVAPACNIQCRYCIRKYDCANESRPGITSRVTTPTEAMERVRILLDRSDRISVIGIAGPGDPLANESSFEVLSMIKKEFPDLTLCVSTNGLLLPERLEDLVQAGVRSLTITINAMVPEIAEKIYSHVMYRGKRYTGTKAAEQLLCNQWQGLSKAKEAGLIVKVNSVLIPGVNDNDIPIIALYAGKKKADIMNIIPLIPQAELKHIPRPSHEMLKAMREKCGRYLTQMSHCRQCRADAFGTLGEDRDMELEIINSQIGDEYCEIVH